MNPIEAYRILHPSANAFCPTGKGGGRDPTCSPGKGGRGGGGIGSPSKSVVDRYNEFYGNLPPKKLAMMQDMANEIAKKDVYIAIKPDALGKVLNEGRFKTAHETSKSNGYFDSESRLEFEEGYFQGSPIYGYMSDGGQSGEASMLYPSRGKPYIGDGVEQYGSARVKLKQSVRDRATFTSDDSWDFNKGGVSDAIAKGTPNDARRPVQFLPSSVNDPKSHSILPSAGKSYYKDVNSTTHSSDYFEAQIHGGVSVNDIEHVVFFSKPPNKPLMNSLNKKNITWEFKEYEAS